MAACPRNHRFSHPGSGGVLDQQSCKISRHLEPHQLGALGRLDDDVVDQAPQQLDDAPGHLASPAARRRASRRPSAGSSRLHASSIGLDHGFTIHDREDSADLLNLVRHELGLSEKAKRFPMKATCLAIYSRAVNAAEPLDVVLRKQLTWCVANGQNFSPGLSS